MKNRFSTLDVFAIVHDLKRCEGMRVINVYDMDNKTYLFKLQRNEEKAVILIESGLRVHLTSHDWPKQIYPSSFSMKLRKHIRQKHLDFVVQLGVDRILDLRFGSGDGAVHVIVELYDRGNILLTDSNHLILNILRPRTDVDSDVRFVVREIYNTANVRHDNARLSGEQLRSLLADCEKKEQLKRFLVPHLPYGPALIEHCLLSKGFPSNAQMGIHVIDSDIDRLMSALEMAEELYGQVRNIPSPGYINVKVEQNVVRQETIESYQEYNPILFQQFTHLQSKRFDSFTEAVDEFYSKRETQREEHRALTTEREALKKLDNVKKDHMQRLTDLQSAQQDSARFAELIEMNHVLVDRAILVVRSAIANKLAWHEIDQMVRTGKQNGDEAAIAIIKLDLDNNAMILALNDPYEEDGDRGEKNVRIRLDLAAHQNARRYFDDRRSAVGKQHKTELASKKALKSAQIKTEQTIKHNKIRTNIMRNRKAMWFEKFHWFISSDHLLVISGRDAHQNEYIVKKHLRPGDVYVHADMRGASSVVVKAVDNAPIPPKTLNEAGAMAICQSAAWDARVVAGAWWVSHDQVSRTAPTGEYLTAGSFMIRGKKNFLPPSQLVMGFGFMFKLDEDSVERRRLEKVFDAQQEEEGQVEIEEKEEEELDEDNSSSSSDSDEGLESEKDEFPDVQIDVNRQLSVSDDFTILQLGPIRRPNAKTPAQDEQKDETTIDTGKKPTPTVRSKKTEQINKPNPPQIRAEKREETKEETKKKEETKEETKKREETKEETKKREETKEEAVDDVVEDAELAAENEAEAIIEMSSLLDTVTWNPLESDRLVFALPVCAPYSAMTSFKYKVKLTPGTTKRGKAAKSAVALFQRDRGGTSPERDLLKVAVQEQDVGRGMPGKVKVSAPLLSAGKSKN